MRTGVSFQLCRCVFVLFLFAVVSAPALPGSIAQTATGAITGTVTDPNGLATADANVVVKNTDTGSETTYTSNSSGLYAAPYLQPGRYEVSLSKTGACSTHTNGCLLPSPSFGSVSTTSGALYGARQLQFGARFEF
jgi:hypothetical protein